MWFFQPCSLWQVVRGEGRDGHSLVNSGWSYPIFVPLSHYSADSCKPLGMAENVGTIEFLCFRPISIQ